MTAELEAPEGLAGHAASSRGPDKRSCASQHPPPRGVRSRRYRRGHAAAARDSPATVAAAAVKRPPQPRAQQHSQRPASPERAVDL
ncbi:UNVERIFIED_CONTAM: hypothetical protein K2H54_032827 [Gekko kuhli]